VQLHLLYVFDAICKEYNLTYFLGGGTLLGAMRHGGFIPWDDDLDVGMPLKDYKKFLKIAPNVLPKDVLLQTPKTNPHTALPFSKLRDAYSFYYEMRPDIATSDFAGIYLDIFPYEEVPEMPQRVRNLFVKTIASSWMRNVYFKHWGLKSGPHAIVGAFLCLALSCIYVITRGVLKCLSLVLPCETTLIQLENGMLFTVATNNMYPTKRMRFEDGDFPVPNAPEAFLESQYGNWREIPPPEKRPRHAKIILSITSQDLPGALSYPTNE
jgi:lipopolysaccharide cholinephosphotransferase